jgi:tetratricopeptide (TPR) repeat protein
VTTASEAINSAFARHQAGDLDAAEALYHEVLNTEPDNLNGLQLLGVLIHQRGRSAEAVTLLQHAIAVLERRGDEGPQHAALYNNLGNALRAAGRPADAAAHYRHGIALDPDLAELHANLGNALLEQGDCVNAVASYETAQRMGPLSAQCTSNLANAYTAVGRFDDAERVYLDTPVALAGLADPASDDADAWVRIARLLNARSDHKAAEEVCRSALKLTPGHSGALLTLAGILVDTGTPAEAADVCRRLVKEMPEDATVHYILGRALTDLDDNPGAIEALRHCLQINPRHAGALYNLGALLAKVGLNDLAVPLLEMAIEVQPDDVKSYAALGNVLLARGDTARALACFRRACELQPLATWPAANQPAELSVLLVQAPGAANTPPDFLFANSSYDRHFYALLPDIAPDMELLRRHGDLVVNLISDVDQGPEMLLTAADVIDRLGKPTVNHPRRILGTGRDAIPKLLADIPSCRVPHAIRTTRAALSASDALARLDRDGFAFPLLLRVAGTHGGDAFEKITSDDGIATFLAEHSAAQEFYVTAYAEYRSHDGHFRKYRFVFTNDEILPYHLAIGNDWKVHHYSTEMDRHAWMQEEELAFLENPGGVFSLAHYEALAGIRAAVGLEFFGIDCSLDHDGNVLVFEVNASMLIHNDNADFPYKTPYCVRIKEAFEAMLVRTAAGGKS